MQRILTVLFLIFGLGGAAMAQDATQLVGEAGDRVLGDPNAPVTIMEFSSLSCPHCARFHKETLPELKKKYIDTGKVKLVYKDFPFGTQATVAAMVARCLPPKRYFKFLDVLFLNQELWAWENNFHAPLSRIAKMAGMSQEKYEACVQTDENLNAVAAAKMVGTNEHEVQATPTFIINGEEKIEGFQTFSDMESYLEDYVK